MNLKIICKIYIYLHFSDTRRSLKIKLKNKNSCMLEHLYILDLCFIVKFVIKI